MKLFDLKDKNNKSTDLFRVENYTSKEEVMKKLNSIFSITNVYTDEKEGQFNYIYVADDGSCRFVESLNEFSENYQTEEDWRVHSSVEVK
jgi:mRNA deadenylase 3'-5' endonuclease subunit Ccr4